MPKVRDLYTTARFRVTIQKEDGTSVAEGFFQGCSIPTFSAEAITFREGTRNYPYKQPGLIDVDDVTLKRGVIMGGSSLFDWMQSVITHQPSYRAKVTIEQFHHSALAGDSIEGAEQIPAGQSPKPVRRYILHKAFPTKCKPSTDLDAKGEEVALEDLTITFEYFTIERDES